MSKELYKRYRPKQLKDVLGQATAIKSLEKMLANDSLPHALLLAGPSGVGKTTIARILKNHLKCSEQDFFERNCADFRGVDDIREMRKHCGYMPLGGRCRIWLIDECHKLTNDAQNALLKMLEDTPNHIYYILCTTDPQKLIKTIRTRCSLVKLAAITPDVLEKLVRTTAEAEGVKLKDNVVEELVEMSEGSGRQALVILEQVLTLEDPKEQLEAIRTFAGSKDAAFDICRALMQGAQWSDVARLLRSVEEQDAEGLRYMILGYARACMLGKKDGAPNPKLAAKAYLVVDVFGRNFYDSKHAGLAAACWEVLQQVGR